MFLISSLLVAICFSRALAQNCVDKYGNFVPNRGETVQGNGFFTCNNGRLTLSGCNDPEIGNLRFGQRVTGTGYERTCVEESPGVAYLKPTACVFEGRVVQVGENVRTNYYIYECRADEVGVNMEVVACRDSDGRRVAPGGRVVRGKTVYQCQPDANGNTVIVPVGCVYEDAEFPIGTTYEGNEYWFQCREFPDGTVYGQVQGCMSRGRRVGAGTTYQHNGFEMECQRTTNGIERRVIGCLEVRPDGSTQSHPVGSRWVQGDPPFQYAMTCRTCGDGRTVTRSPSKCQFNVGLYREPLFEVDPGCMVPKGNQIYCCGTSPRGDLMTQVDNIDQMGKYREKGYRRC